MSASLETHKEDTAHPASYYVGWDVGGWNCETETRKRGSRDAIVVLDSKPKVVGKRQGNLREEMNKATPGNWIQTLFRFCHADHPGDSAAVTMAIDIPLGFPEAFVRLVNEKKYVGEVVQGHHSNPYLFRRTEQYLHNLHLVDPHTKKQQKPLSAIGDRLGNQVTKGLHMLAKFAPQVESCGVWSDGHGDGHGFHAIETYPAPCRRSGKIEKLGRHQEKLGKLGSDLEDALLCALVSFLYETERSALEAPCSDIPREEGWIWVPKDIRDCGHP
jgi:hypothetical protein